jgi:REP element-mobilizing transposase RayT
MPLRTYRRRLPHWRVEGATYLVTWCLRRNRAGLDQVEREATLEVIRRYDRAHFDLIAVAVMDDHVHVLVTPHEGWPLERLIQGWKAAAAHRLRHCGRHGPFWQREYHDRIIRSRSDLLEKIRYLANNPRKRWPEITDYPWLYVKVGAEL